MSEERACTYCGTRFTVPTDNNFNLTRIEYDDLWSKVHRYCLCPECHHLVECDHAGVGTCRHCSYIVLPSECDDIDIVATFNNAITNSSDVMKYRVKEGDS